MDSIEATLEVVHGAMAAGGKEVGAMIEGVKNAVDIMKQELPAYQCRQCGYKANTLYWLCPSCHNWASVKPSVPEPSS